MLRIGDPYVKQSQEMLQNLHVKLCKVLGAFWQLTGI